jgi:hypothetical protein
MAYFETKIRKSPVCLGKLRGIIIIIFAPAIALHNIK